MNEKRPVVILGGGVAGLAAAEALVENELPCVIVEKEETLGGHVKNWACTATDRCLGCYCCKVDDLIHNVRSSDKVSVELGCELSQLIRDGSKIEKVGIRSVQTSAEKFIGACAVVVAVGFQPYNPSEKGFWGYQRLGGVATLVELNEWVQSGNLSSFVSEEDSPLRIAFFQCVGSRDCSINANYCSEYCCNASLRMALNLLYNHPRWDFTLFYIDLQITGKMAGALLKDAQSQGIHLVQGVPGEIVEAADGRLSVASTKNGVNVREEFDKIVLCTGQQPAQGLSSLAGSLGLNLDQFGFISQSHSHSGGRSATPGVYVAGTCTEPGGIQKSLLSANHTAALIIADYPNL